VNKKKPINLDLMTMRFPVMAIVSILHRLSGVLLFLLMPVILYFLSLSLADENSFFQLQALFEQPFIKILLWLFTSALVYHLLAGFRHLIMDLGLGEELITARRTATFIIIAALILAIAVGVWIW
jgi:succinate dehydrogenase / fumarate reductase cytochrome b subunit